MKHRIHQFDHEAARVKWLIRVSKQLRDTERHPAPRRATQAEIDAIQAEIDAMMEDSANRKGA